MPGRPTKPPVSQRQRRAFYAAKAGHSNLGIPQQVGAEKVEAGHGVRGLPDKIRHDTAPPGGFAHMGTTVEGPHFRGAEKERATPGVGANVGGAAPTERTKAFANAGSSREGPRFGRATTAGPTVEKMGAYPEEHGFANAGSTREGPDYEGCLSVRREGWGTDGISRMRVRRGPHDVVGRDRLSGDHPDGFRTHLTHTAGDTDGRHGHDEHAYAGPQLGHPTPHSTPVHSGAHAREPDVVHNSPPKYRSRRERGGDTAPVEHRASLGKPVLEAEGKRGFRTQEHTAPRERANAETHYGLRIERGQPSTRDIGGYEGGREANWSPSAGIRGGQHQQGPRHGPGSKERHAFKMAEPEEHLQGKKWIGGAIKHPGALTRAAASHGVSKRAEARRESHSANPHIRARGALGLRFMGGGDLHRGRKSA